MFNIADVFTAAGLATLGQVILIDLIFSGDNAMVLGTLAAGLPAKQRKQVLALGVVMAMVCLIGFALIATQLLHVVGLLLAGGILLLWVAWKLYREIGATAEAASGGHTASKHPKTFAQAAIQVAITNLSLSLDNVLAVAGAAREHPAVLFFGLALSVTLMAVAANFIARVIGRYHWIAYIGLAVILFVAGRMIYDGIVDHEIGVLRLLF
ncbi:MULTISPECIES: YjbE family putative metal transport protein [Sphingomonas]|jgi:YjbE family integral membrane protein|uniref:YjbE family putative metal transport protein n=1 Tax=Sphingomonas TaxID=13687 RepID=UPI001AE22951